MSEPREPLRIDIVDTASSTRIAGCWLQVGPAAGTGPADALTAEAARLGRVMLMYDGQEATALRPPQDPGHHHSRLTFDLRRIG